MRFYSRIFLVIIFCTALFFVLYSKTYATPACGGTITCYSDTTICEHSDGSNVGCNPKTDSFCNCSPSCDGSKQAGYPCSSFSSSQCTDTSFGATFCNTQCAGFGGGGGMVTDGCFLQPDQCTVGSDCASGICCAGSPNSCSVVGYNCAGQPLATPTPTVPPPVAPSPCNTPTSVYSGGSDTVTFNWTRQQSGIDYQVSWDGSGGAHDAGVDSSSFTYPGFAPNNTFNYYITPYNAGGAGPACSYSITTVSAPAATPTPSASCQTTAGGNPYECVNSSFSSGVQTCTTSSGKAGYYNYIAGSYNDCTGATPECAICQASATPTPTTAVGAPTATPTPTGGTCTAGQFQCSTICCPNGDGCEAGVGGAGQCDPPIGSGGSCTEPSGLSGTVFMDNNNDNLYDAGDTGVSAGPISYYAGNGVVGGYPHALIPDGSGNFSDSGSVSGVNAYITYNGGSPYYFRGFSIASWITTSPGNCTGPFYQYSNTNPTYLQYGGHIVNVLVGNTPLPSIVFNVFIDSNGNGIKDSGESGYQNVQGTLNIGTTYQSRGNTNNNGSYTFSNLYPNNPYSVSIQVPSGYTVATNPVSLTTGSTGQTIINFPLLPPAPACTGGMSATSTTVNPGGTSTLSVTSCTNVNTAPPTPFTWNPDTNSNNPPPTVSGQTDSPTSSTVTWTAPVCPLTQKTYTPQVAVGGPGGTTNYTTNIVVPQTYTLKADIRSVADSSPCTPTSGNPYTLSSVTLQAQGPTMDTETTSTGSATFACLVAGSYKVFMATPAGYSILGTSGGTFANPNEIDTTVGPSNPNPEVAYCIAPINPWFQTDSGDARFSNLKDPVPTGEVASTDPNYPGLFISSNSPSDFGQGVQSTKNLTLDDEYSFNQNSQNRNGTVGFDYYLNQASTKGVSIVNPPINDVSQIQGTGVYEYPTDDTNPIITQFSPSLFTDSTTGKSTNRITILFPNDVTIDTNITVPKGALLIIAAKGDITVDSSVTELDGYYSAQGSINLNSRDSRTPKCQDATLLDQQLVVNGALIANALKPFSTTGTGVVQNDRTLCLNNLTTPSLVVKSRLDFLTLMTDFYKVSLSRLSE